MDGPFYQGSKRVLYVVEGEGVPTLVRIKIRTEAGVETTFETERNDVDYTPARWIATTTAFFDVGGWWDRFDLLFGAADSTTPSETRVSQFKVHPSPFTNLYDA